MKKLSVEEILRHLVKLQHTNSLLELKLPESLIKKAQTQLDQLYLNKYLELPSMQDEEVHDLQNVSWDETRKQAAKLGRNQLRKELRYELTKRLKDG